MPELVLSASHAEKHLLFLTGFDPALLDERYRALLGEAKPGEAPMVAARSSGA